MTISWVDSLLARWGRWSIKRESSALGYGSASPMFRDCATGGGWSGDSDPGFTPRDVIDCDAAVNILPLCLRVVVIEYYQRNESLRDVARACGISHPSASQYLHRAHVLIDQELSDLKIGVDNQERCFHNL